MIEFKTLSKGSKNNNVAMVQFFLRSNGYVGWNGKPLDVDGDFGTQTEYAVMSFQKLVNAYTVNGTKLRTDGVWDGDCYRKALGA